VQGSRLLVLAAPDLAESVVAAGAHRVPLVDDRCVSGVMRGEAARFMLARLGLADQGGETHTARGGVL
jgi:hypothetical protein